MLLHKYIITVSLFHSYLEEVHMGIVWFFVYFLYSDAWPLVCVYDPACQKISLDYLDEMAGQRYNLTEQCDMYAGPRMYPDECVSCHCYFGSIIHLP